MMGFVAVSHGELIVLEGMAGCPRISIFINQPQTVYQRPMITGLFLMHISRTSTWYLSTRKRRAILINTHLEAAPLIHYIVYILTGLNNLIVVLYEQQIQGDRTSELL